MRVKFIMTLLAWGFVATSAAATQPAETLETGTDSAFYMSDAAYYPAGGDKAVVLVPGFIFNKESWKKLAVALQAEEVASVAISAKSENQIRRAIQELTRRGHGDIVLIGGSSGAAAILNTMEQVVSTDTVSGVVLLSPVRGNPMDDQPVDKLFIVSEGEKSFEKVQALHAGSMEPKTLVTLPGKAHAQFLFFGPDKARVETAIVEFVTAR